jgi:hypothetical protein
MLLRQLTRVEDTDHMRFKRGVFHFIGGIIKILFGTMDNDDASYYYEKILRLEKERLDFLTFERAGYSC